MKAHFLLNSLDFIRLAGHILPRDNLTSLSEQRLGWLLWLETKLSAVKQFTPNRMVNALSILPIHVYQELHLGSGHNFKRAAVESLR
jgi:hypothetical protein